MPNWAQVVPYWAHRFCYIYWAHRFCYTEHRLCHIKHRLCQLSTGFAMLSTGCATWATNNWWCCSWCPLSVPFWPQVVPYWAHVVPITNYVPGVHYLCHCCATRAANICWLRSWCPDHWRFQSCPELGQSPPSPEYKPNYTVTANNSAHLTISRAWLDKGKKIFYRQPIKELVPMYQSSYL